MPNTSSTSNMAKPWSGKSVVIIDDSPNVRAQLKAAFTACGMQVVGEAENGAKGLELVHAHNPELISLDIIMPEMDGVECYRRLTGQEISSKIMVITWLASDPKVVESLKSVIPENLLHPKPVNTTRLTSMLERLYFPEQTHEPRMVLEDAPIKATGTDDLDIKVS